MAYKRLSREELNSLSNLLSNTPMLSHGIAAIDILVLKAFDENTDPLISEDADRIHKYFFREPVVCSKDQDSLAVVTGALNYLNNYGLLKTGENAISVYLQKLHEELERYEELSEPLNKKLQSTLASLA